MTDSTQQPAVIAVGRALPPHHVSQQEIADVLQEAWSEAHYNVDRLQDLHRAVQVKGRHFPLLWAE